MHFFGRWGSVLAVCALLALPLANIFRYPDRISALSSLQVDAVAYDTIGVHLANERTLNAIPPLQPPGFVVLLALIFIVFGHSWMAAKLALWMMLACSTAVAGRLARRVYDSAAAGWIAALLCASSPALGWYAQTLQYELVAALFVIGLVVLATHATSGQPRALSTTRAVSAGLLLGAAALTREVLIVLVPVVALAVAVRARSEGGLRRALGAAALIVIIPVVMSAGWSAVQSARTGRLIALSDKGPAVLMFGNNPLANGTFNAGAVGVAEPSGFAFIRAEPRWAAWLAMRKVLYFWGVLRDGWNVPRPAALWASRATGGWLPLEHALPWARGGWILATLLAALLMWTQPMWRAWWPIPAAIALVMAVHVVTLSSHRFAVPILPLAFVVASGPLARFVRAMWQGPRRRWAAAAIAVAILAMQLPSWRLAYSLLAFEMDPSQSDDVHDDATGSVVRFADTARGPRTVFALIDEALPAGAFDIRIDARTDTPVIDEARTGLRVTVTTLEGTRACTHEVLASVFTATYQQLSLPCSLDRSGPVSLIAETLAVIPLRVSSVTLAWRVP